VQAIILAAGMGRRLGAHSKNGPKCLVDVAGRSILEWQLDALRTAGIEDLVVVTGYAAEQVEAALTGGRATVVRNERYQETNVLASWALGSESLHDDHVFMHGDTIFEPALLTRLLDKACSPITLTIDGHACAEEEMKVVVDGARVLEISKGIEPARASGEFTGVLLARAEVLEPLRRAAARLLAMPGGSKAFFEAAIVEVMADRPEAVGWVDVTGLRWREVDFPEDLAAARAMFNHHG
jgi:choline kinase